MPSFNDGSEQQDDDGTLDDDRENLHGSHHHAQLLPIIDTTGGVGKWVFNAGGRCNHTDVNNTDRLPPTNVGPSTGADRQITPSSASTPNRRRCLQARLVAERLL